MSIATEVLSARETELQAMRQNWGWLLAAGIALVVLGMAACIHTLFWGVAVVLALGILFLAGGITEIFSSFMAKGWGGFFLHLLAGVLYFVVGLLVVEKPRQSLVALTLMVAAMLFIGGLFRIIFSLVHRFHSWGWVLANGVISLVLGGMIWKQWPDSGDWVIGLFFGLEMLFTGWAFVMMALAVHNLPAKV